MNAPLSQMRKPATPARSAKMLRRVCAAAVSLALGACASSGAYIDYEKDVIQKTEQQRIGPKTAPTQTVTSFASALRCMDIMFMTYGVRDVGVLIEDIPDSTRKVKAGSKDMIISAVSQMSRRSRGIRLVAFSINDQTLGAVVGFGTRDRVIDDTPDFTIRGSISQFDDAIVRKQGDAGIGIGAVSAGIAKQGNGSVLALDLSMINTNRLTLVPGVISKNSVLVLRQGSGADGEVSTRKFGLNFSFTLSKSEGTAQALRTLAELATIELFGKLTKTPYWTCLGATDEEPMVNRELTDWWETLAAQPESLVAYFQQQMRARGLYPGEVNGQADDALLKAIEVYQRAMGREPTPTLDFDFFRAYLKTDHVEATKRAAALVQDNPLPEPVAKVGEGNETAPGVAPADSAGAPTAQSVGAGPIAKESASIQQVAVQRPSIQQVVAQTASVQPAPSAPGNSSLDGGAPFVYIVGSQGKNVRHSRGQPFQIDVAVDQTAYLYCFLLDENRRVNQFFPNPAQPDARVEAGSRMRFPGDLPFRLVASPRGGAESISCYAAPQSLGMEPLKTMPVATGTQEITSSIRRLAGPNLGIGVYDVQIQ